MMLVSVCDRLTTPNVVMFFFFFFTFFSDLNSFFVVLYSQKYNSLSLTFKPCHILLTCSYVLKESLTALIIPSIYIGPEAINSQV